MYFLTNKLKYKFVALALISSFALVSSCKDEENSPFEDVTVQFVAIASPDVTMKAVVTQVGVEQSQNFDVADKFVFMSVPRIVNSSVGALHLASTANSTDIDGELIVKILVNGQVKATDTISGNGSLIATTQFNFLD